MKMSSAQREVSVYRKSKSSVPTRNGFGLYLGCSLRDEWVTKGTSWVCLELESYVCIPEIKLRRGFWKQCPEFMADEIYDWYLMQGLPIPWPSGKPPRFVIERVEGQHFRVKKSNKQHFG